MLDRANLLNLSAPEMTVLPAVMRVLDTHFQKTKHGVFERKDASGKVRWAATAADLVFGYYSQLRLLAGSSLPTMPQKSL